MMATKAKRKIANFILRTTLQDREQVANVFNLLVMDGRLIRDKQQSIDGMVLVRCTLRHFLGIDNDFFGYSIYCAYF